MKSFSLIETIYYEVISINNGGSWISTDAKSTLVKINKNSI